MSKIEIFVFQLYGLTEERIKIVEGKIMTPEIPDSKE